MNAQFIIIVWEELIGLHIRWKYSNSHNHHSAVTLITHIVVKFLSLHFSYYVIT